MVCMIIESQSGKRLLGWHFCMIELLPHNHGTTHGVRAFTWRLIEICFGVEAISCIHRLFSILLSSTFLRIRLWLEMSQPRPGNEISYKQYFHLPLYMVSDYLCELLDGTSMHIVDKQDSALRLGYMVSFDQRSIHMLCEWLKNGVLQVTNRRHSSC